MGSLDSIAARSNLTRRQLWVWAEGRLAPDAPAGHMVMTFDVAGRLDAERFRAALRAELAASDALRTVIVERDGAPWQEVRPEPTFDLELRDLAGEPAPPAALANWLERNATEPFAPGQALGRTALLRLAPERFVWALVLSHTITDGVSFASLYRRVEARYRGETPEPLPPFSAYREAERAYRGSERAARAEAFWQERLSRPPPALELYGRAPRKGAAIMRRSVELGAERSRALARAAGGALPSAGAGPLAQTIAFAAVVAAWGARMSGQRCVGIGLPLANRTRPLRETLGLLMEVCPLRVEVAREDRFADLFARVRDELRATFPFARHSVSHPVSGPAYDLLLNLHPGRFPDFAGHPTRAESLTGLNWWAGDAAGWSAGDPLLLQLSDFAGRGALRLDFDVRSAFLDPAQHQRAEGHLLRMLDAALADSDARPAEVACLDEEEARIVGAPGRVEGSAAATGRVLDAAGRPAPLGVVGAFEPAGPGGPRAAGARARRRPDGAVELVDEVVRPAAAPASAGPRDALEALIARLWREELQLARVGIHDDFFDLGGHSIPAIRILERLREEGDVGLELTALVEAPTVAGLAELARAPKPAAEAWHALVPIRAGGGRPPIYCAAGAGGNITNLRGLARHLGEDQPFFGLRVRGIEHGQKPHERIEDIASESLAEILAQQPAGPRVLAGYSAGGAVAFEIARQLGERGEPVLALVFLDAYAPSVRRRTRGERLALHWQQLRRDPSYLLTKGRDRARGDLARLRNLALRARSRLAPREHHHVRVVEQRARIQERYRPQPWNGRATLVAVERSNFGRGLRYAWDETHGWGDWVLGGVERITIPGGHLDMADGPYAAELAAALRDVIDRALRAAPPAPAPSHGST